MTSPPKDLNDMPAVIAAERCWDDVPDDELLELIQHSRSRDAMPKWWTDTHPWLPASLLDTSEIPLPEEAFQATFLVLFQSANKIRKKSSLASFLFGVALPSKKTASNPRNAKHQAAIQTGKSKRGFPS